MKVMVIPENGSPYSADIPNELQPIQDLIGGYIEVVPLWRGVVALVDEEGKLKNRAPNVWVEELNDWLCGTVIICGVDGEDFCDLPEGGVEL